MYWRNLEYIPFYGYIYILRTALTMHGSIVSLFTQNIFRMVVRKANRTIRFGSRMTTSLSISVGFTQLIRLTSNGQRTSSLQQTLVVSIRLRCGEPAEIRRWGESVLSSLTLATVRSLYYRAFHSRWDDHIELCCLPFILCISSTRE